MYLVACSAGSAGSPTVVSLANFSSFFFFIIAAATAEIYTLSLHDALPILIQCLPGHTQGAVLRAAESSANLADRKSTRLNSSHRCISYAVFCLKKKNN